MDKPIIPLCTGDDRLSIKCYLILIKCYLILITLEINKCLIVPMHAGISWVSFIMASLSVVRSIMRQISNLRPLVIYCLNFKRNYLKNGKSYDNAIFCIRKSVKRRTKRFSTLKKPLEHYFGRKMGLKLSYYTIKEVAVFPIK